MRLRTWAITTALLLGAAAFAGDDELAAENHPAPAFRLPAYNPAPGAPALIGLDRFVGPSPAQSGVKVLLVDFMSSDCKPCKKEMPALEQLQQRFGPKGLQILMISVDAEPEKQKVVEQLIAQNGLHFPVLKDRFKLVARRWLGPESALPSMFLIRSDGTITKVHRGYDEKTSASLASEIGAELGVAAAH